MSEEDRIHAEIASWLRDHIAGRILWWHTTNGGYRRTREAKKLKRNGVRAGVPDLAFIIPPNGRAAYIEIKTTDKRSKADTNQFAFGEKAKMDGALYAVCRSLDEVQGTLKGWGVA